MGKFFASFMTLMVFLFMPLMLLAQVADPPDETNWILVIISGVVLVFDVIARAIPNTKWKGLIGLLIKVLNEVSEYVNNKGDD